MHRLVASWFGTGLILGQVRGSHLGSGTLGSLFTLPVALAVGAWLGWPAQIAAAVVVAAASVWSVGALFASEGDAGWIVIEALAHFT